MAATSAGSCGGVEAAASVCSVHSNHSLQLVKHHLQDLRTQHYTNTNTLRGTNTTSFRREIQIQQYTVEIQIHTTRKINIETQVYKRGLYVHYFIRDTAVSRQELKSRTDYFCCACCSLSTNCETYVSTLNSHTTAHISLR